MAPEHLSRHLYVSLRFLQPLAPMMYRLCLVWPCWPGLGAVSLLPQRGLASSCNTAPGHITPPSPSLTSSVASSSLPVGARPPQRCICLTASVMAASVCRASELSVPAAR